MISHRITNFPCDYQPDDRQLQIKNVSSDLINNISCTRALNSTIDRIAKIKLRFPKSSVTDDDAYYDGDQQTPSTNGIYFNRSDCSIQCSPRWTEPVVQQMTNSRVSNLGIRFHLNVLIKQNQKRK